MRTACLLIFCLAFAGSVNGQQNALTPKQSLSPRQHIEQYLNERHRLQQQAKAAFDAEMARANRAGRECANVDTTRAAEECLSKESDATEANYQSFVQALRALLSQSPPDRDETPAVGPEGPELTPAQSAAEFDKVQQLWTTYRDALCTAAFHQGGGGTISPVLDIECRRDAIRNHMRDLDRAYGLLLSIR
jgi:uncharacterized protein YecT (DUF1311 family)